MHGCWPSAVVALETGVAGTSLALEQAWSSGDMGSKLEAASEGAGLVPGGLALH